MNARNNQKHTRIGIEMVRKIFEEGKRIFTIADARKGASNCGMADNYVAEALHHLSNNGWIKRLKRGLYIISSSFPGMTPVHEFEIAMALVQPSAISHWSALHFHGMTEQIPQRVYITTTQAVPISRAVKIGNKNLRSFSREINGILYEFIKIKPERFFGIKDFWVGELAKMIDYSLRLDAVIAKRLGWVMEKVGVEDSMLQKLEATHIMGYRVLDSTGPRKGHCNKRWMIQENLPGRIFR